MSATPRSRVQHPAASAVAAQVSNLVKVYGRGEAAVRALDGADLDIIAGA